jgi:hypothetical protein
VEAAGIEPSFDFDATDSAVYDRDNCQQCRTAYALPFECFKSRLLASLDADLQHVIASWNGLRETTRRAIARYLHTRLKPDDSFKTV